MNYLELIQVQWGIPLWLLITILAWTAVWKLLALWKSARKKHVAWFIILAIVNTLGILEILYIYIFSETRSGKKSQSSKKPKRKRRK